VLLDDLGGARGAVEHLIAHGHTRIACVADDAGLYTMRQRIAGYREALQAAGIDEDPSLVVTGNRDVAAAEAAVARLLEMPDKRRPTALFTANNRNTIGALHALPQARGPVALVGFDDFELADLLGTTVVRADAWKLGEQAAALAFARLDGDDDPPRTVTIPTGLIARGSGEIPA
jgi:LacI family transcriptional regulator